jgi:hypothetical protein
VRGLGGVGKTVLAQAYAWRNWDRYHRGGYAPTSARPSSTTSWPLGRWFIPGFDAQEPEEAAHTTLDRIAQMLTDKP